MAHPLEGSETSSHRLRPGYICGAPCDWAALLCHLAALAPLVPSSAWLEQSRMERDFISIVVRSMRLLPSAMASCAMALGAALGITITGVLLYRFLLARQHLAAFPGPAPQFLLGNLAMLVGAGGKVMPLFRLHHVLAQRYEIGRAHV